jgi:hypothetical protein
MWVVVHICNKAIKQQSNKATKESLCITVFISNWQKCYVLSYYLLCFLFNKIREREGRTGSARKLRVWGEVAQIRYTHVIKCKND